MRRVHGKKRAGWRARSFPPRSARLSGSIARSGTFHRNGLPKLPTSTGTTWHAGARGTLRDTRSGRTACAIRGRAAGKADHAGRERSLAGAGSRRRSRREVSRGQGRHPNIHTERAYSDERTNRELRAVLHGLDIPTDRRAFDMKHKRRAGEAGVYLLLLRLRRRGGGHRLESCESGRPRESE